MPSVEKMLNNQDQDSIISKEAEIKLTGHKRPRIDDGSILPDSLSINKCKISGKNTENATFNAGLLDNPTNQKGMLLVAKSF